MNLSNNERKLLGLLHFNAHLPLTEVARQLGCHYNTASRTFDRLRERAVIRPITRVNLRALGYKVYSAWCTLSDYGSQELPDAIQHLLACPNVVFTATVCGEYDLVIYFAAHERTEVESTLGELTAKVGAIFSKTTILSSYYWYSFSKQHYLQGLASSPPQMVLYHEPSTSSHHDLLDLRLIESLNDNPLVSQRQLSTELNIPFQTINYRIDRLQRSAILLGSELSLNRATLNIQSYTLLVRTNELTEELERSLLVFCRDYPNVIGCGKRAGEWNFEIQAEISELSELQQIRFTIRQILGTDLVTTSLLVIDKELIERHQVYRHHKHSEPQDLRANA
jgi:DNA-binding Lrp family transcriptional regulator